MVPAIGDSRATLRGPVVSRRPRLRGHLHQSTPGRLQIVRAVPRGARVARSQHAWLQAVDEHPATAQLRADAHGHLVAVAEVLAWSADWRSRTTRPTWARLCERTGLGRRTVARWLAWLREAGLLGVVESGSTPQLRPMALAHLEGNRAALYVLAARPQGISVNKTGTPSDLTEGESPTHARSDLEQSPLRGPDHRNAATKTDPQQPAWRWTAATTHSRSRLGCAQRLQERVPALRRLSDRHLRHLLRPWLIAGWTAADVAWAIDHAPDDTAHTWTTDVRSAKGWLAHRLRLWTDAAGLPLPAPSAARASEHQAHLSQQAAARANQAAGRAVLEAERSLADRLQVLDGARWAQLLGRFVRGRRAPGPMSESLARSAVVTALTETGWREGPAAASDDLLLAALEAAATRTVA